VTNEKARLSSSDHATSLPLNVNDYQHKRSVGMERKRGSFMRVERKVEVHEGQGKETSGDWDWKEMVRITVGHSCPSPSWASTGKPLSEKPLGNG